MLQEHSHGSSRKLLAVAFLPIIVLTFIALSYVQRKIPTVNLSKSFNNQNPYPPDRKRASYNSLLTQEQLLYLTKHDTRRFDQPMSRSYLTIHPLDGSAGRLGNFLFRYAAALQIAERHNMMLVLPDTTLVEGMREKFHITAPTENELRIKPVYMEVHEKNWGIFDPNLFSLPGSNNIRLELSYTQSFKYFHRIHDQIRREFTIKPQYADKGKAFVQSIRVMYQAAAVIGMHIRRGDFVKPSFDNYGYTVAPKKFFTNATNYLVEKYGQSIVFLVASDDQQWCMSNLDFGQVKHIYSVNQTAMGDFAMLTYCDHHVVSVGSFGWWTAWLGYGEVVYYKKWPRPGSPHSKNHNPQHYYPPHWTALE